MHVSDIVRLSILSLTLCFFDLSLHAQNRFTSAANKIYAHSCGRANQTTAMQKQLHSFIQEQDSVAINKWLHSPSIVKRMYAVQGFYFLQKDHHYEMTKHQLRKCERIKQKRFKVTTCVGCSLTRKKVCDLLQYFNFEPL